MLMGFQVSIHFCKPEIDDVYLVSTLAYSNQKVVRFDITMDEAFGMKQLNEGNRLARTLR